MLFSAIGVKLVQKNEIGAKDQAYNFIVINMLYNQNISKLNITYIYNNNKQNCKLHVILNENPNPPAMLGRIV